MRHPNALDTIALLGLLAIIVGAGIAIGLHTLRLHDERSQQACTAGLEDCLTDRATCEGQRDLALAEGQRLSAHLETLRHTCGGTE